MLTLPTNVKLFLADHAVDFRKGFDGLAAIVEHLFGLEPISGHVFVFLNKRANQVRLLFWERDGFCLVAKRLEAGTFRRVKRADNGSPYIEIDAAELMFVLEGIEVTVIRRRRRYTPKQESRTSVTN